MYQENNNKILCESCKWRVLYQTTQDSRVFFENCSQCYSDGEYENYEKNETSQDLEGIKK